MPEYIPRPQLPTGLIEQTNDMEAHKNDPWAALAAHIGDSVKTGIKNYQDRQPFTPDQTKTLNKGEVPADLPKSQAAPLYESANKRKEAEALLASKQDQANYLAANKEQHEKEMEGLKAGHQAELQKAKDDTAKAIAQEKENTAKMLAEERAKNAKSLADFNASHKESLAKLNSALKTGDAAAIKAAADDFNKSVSGSIVKTGLSKIGLLTPPKPATPSKMGGIKVPDGKIVVQDKDGKKHFLPKEQKDEAISQGFTVVTE